jgi:hypothetical protein
MNDHPLPNDLGALVVLGAVLIALAVVLPITHTGALAIAGLALIHVALAAWTVRTLEHTNPCHWPTGTPRVVRDTTYDSRTRTTTPTNTPDVTPSER